MVGLLAMVETNDVRGIKRRDVVVTDRGWWLSAGVGGYRQAEVVTCRG
ncbi:hypothetical protein HanRHA438_Chr05g0246291 [Helianthus annuus]|nr:hypothetical protein HanRHA438_Chr05g0246291 [Helianthus annuus]